MKINWQLSSCFCNHFLGLLRHFDKLCLRIINDHERMLPIYNGTKCGQIGCYEHYYMQLPCHHRLDGQGFQTNPDTQINLTTRCSHEFQGPEPASQEQKDSSPRVPGFNVGVAVKVWFFSVVATRFTTRSRSYHFSTHRLSVQ